MNSAILGTINFFRKALVIVELEIRKMRHDATELLMRAVQPVLWLLLFGEVFAQTHAIPTGNISYLDFLAPGILAQSVLFIAIFGGMSVIWERDLGIIHKFLASPTPRGSLALGKSLSGAARALTQAVVVYILALLIGVKLNWNPFALLGVVIVIILGATLFSAFSLIIAFLVRTRERFMGIGQVLTMPIFFASNAIYPIDIMPPWLKAISLANPLTYEVDALRALMLTGEASKFGLGVDCVVLLEVSGVLIAIATRMYPRMTM